jgi:hypothetical protein
MVREREEGREGSKPCSNLEELELLVEAGDGGRQWQSHIPCKTGQQ